jgi:hypothetical protein
MCFTFITIYTLFLNMHINDDLHFHQNALYLAMNLCYPYVFHHKFNYGLPYCQNVLDLNNFMIPLKHKPKFIMYFFK